VSRGWFRSLSAVLVVTSAAAVVLRMGPETAVGLGTAWLIYLLAVAGWLGSAGDYRPLRSLGRISYSLYLVHPLVYQALFTLTFRYRVASPVLSLVIVAGILTAALLTAHVFYELVERPSLRLSQRIRK